MLYVHDWRVGRAVECTGLENRRTLTGSGGSNPPLSAVLILAFEHTNILTSGKCFLQKSQTYDFNSTR